MVVAGTQAEGGEALGTAGGSGEVSSVHPWLVARRIVPSLRMKANEGFYASKRHSKERQTAKIGF